MGGRDEEEREWEQKSEGMSVFSLSRPVNHNHMHLSDDAQMAREQFLTESISLSDKLPLVDLSLGQFRRALKTHLF